jgi:hypothetical protein
MIDDPDGKHAEEWYPMEQFATASNVGTYPMSKKKRIALLEKQVEDLYVRLTALEARSVRVPGVKVTKNETAPDGSTIFEAEISAALLRSVNVTC